MSQIKLFSPFLRRQAEIEQLLYTNYHWNVLTCLYAQNILHFTECENQQIRNDKKFLMKLYSKQHEHLYVRPSDFASDQLNDRKLVEVLVERHGYLLEYLNNELRNDEKLIRKAISQSGTYLEYASQELRNNYAVVMEAVKKEGTCLKFASDSLRNNIEILKAAVSNDGLALEYASEQLKRNEKVVLLALAKDGNALQFANEELKNNYRIVMRAVTQSGQSLKYASNEMKSNRKIAMKAIKTGCSFVEYYWNEPNFDPVLQYVGNDLINDRKFLLAALKYEGVFIYTWNSNNSYWNDSEIILACFKSKNPPIGFVSNPDISEELRNDLKFMKNLHKHAKSVIQTSFFEGILPLKREERKDYSINSLNLRDNEYDVENIRNDKKLIKETLEKTWRRDFSFKLIRNISEELKDDREFMLELIAIDNYVFEHASDRLKNDREFVKIIIEKNGNLLNYANEELRKDKDLTLLAIQNNLSYYDIHESLVTNVDIISEILLSR